MTQAAPPKAKGSKLIKIVLVISLAFNLLFIGLVAGTMARFGGPGGPGARGAEGGPSLGAALYRALPREERRALRQGILADHRDRLAEERDNTGLAESVLSALRADPFDPDQLAGFAQAQIERRHARGKAVQEAWLRRITDMTTEERADYASRLEEILSRGPRAHKTPKPKRD